MVNGFIRTAASVAYSGAVSVAAFVLPFAAMAAPPDGQSVVVRYSDLDLTTNVGTQMLQTRINHAARAVCGDADTRDLLGMHEVQHCRKVALGSAAPQVEVAIAQARNGRAFAANDVKVSPIR